MKRSLRQHWPEYLIEAWCLGAFMISASFFGTALFHTNSPAVAALGLWGRSFLMGLAMGATAVAIIRSPWGRRSGAHFNPAVTLAFLRLKKIRPADAFFYIVADFAGGVLGVLFSWLVLGELLADASVNFVVTVPGYRGIAVAFVAEAAIAFAMMSMILLVSDSPKYARVTPYAAGMLLAAFITFESPLSGMSMNPARTFASAVFSNMWAGWWIYLTAPPLAMVAAAEVYVRLRGRHPASAVRTCTCNFGELKPLSQTQNAFR